MCKRFKFSAVAVTFSHKNYSDIYKPCVEQHKTPLQ